jgi:hypothetical protein
VIVFDNEHKHDLSLIIAPKAAARKLAASRPASGASVRKRAVERPRTQPRRVNAVTAPQHYYLLSADSVRSGRHLEQAIRASSMAPSVASPSSLLTRPLPKLFSVSPHVGFQYQIASDFDAFATVLGYSQWEHETQL